MLKEYLLDILAAAVPGLALELSENLHREFNYDVVASPSEKIMQVLNPFEKQDDALKKNWFEQSPKKSILFIAPPDERIGRWLAKAVYESRKGATVIGILPLRADKEWFHKYILGVAAEVRFVKLFKSSVLGIPIPCDPIAVVVFKHFKGTTRFTSARYNGEVTEHLN